MKKFLSVFIVVSFAIVGPSSAQNVKLSQAELIEYVRSISENQLHKIPNVGREDRGFYPFCSDVIAAYQSEKTQIAKILLEDAGQDFTELKIQIDWDSTHVHQQVHNDDTMVHEVDFSFPNTYFTCFDAKTAINLLLKPNDMDVNNLAHYQTVEYVQGDIKAYHAQEKFNSKDLESMLILDERGIGTLRTLTDKYNRTHTPYILSSTAGLIADKRYQKDCWSEIKRLYEGVVEHGNVMANTAVREFNPTTKKETVTHILSTPNHRFFACYDDADQGYGCRWTKAAELDASTMRLYSKNATRKIDYVSSFKIEDTRLGSPIDHNVYNLASETYTYYVGDNLHRVLVHNVK